MPVSADLKDRLKKYKLDKHFDIIVIIIVSITFIVIQLIFDYSFSGRTRASYLNPNQQFNIGKAFYLGEKLPKDNFQAFNWLLLSAEQGNKEAQDLIHILGYEASKQQAGDMFQEGLGASASIDVIPPKKIKASLKEIAGLTEAKKEISKLVEFIKNPEKFKKMGAMPPRGIIIYGPPGTGKTYLARALAGEANVTFISASGAQFEEVYQGRGAARVREMFELARRNKPAIIFIDEIDALAPSRKTEDIASSQIQTVNQLLSEMQNVDEEKNSDIYVVGATNRLEALDSALLRPGRFDWQIHVRLPSDADRKAILEKFIKHIKIADDINIDNLVVQSAGYSGADLKNLVNEAAIIAVENNKSAVDMEAFELAFKKIATYEKDLSPTFSAKILSPQEIRADLSNVAGMNEAKKEVTEIIDFLKDPKSFTRLGAKPPSGILIYGPPGTGKTLMARAIAGEAKATFISISGSDFDEKFIGVGAARVRELFKMARKYKPCIVFIDEIDALAPKRSGEESTGKDQTINQLLSEMDNIQNNLNEGIIIIGATNRLDILDPALLRPGRFDRKVYFRLPSLPERAEIINLYLKKIRFAADVNVEILAKITQGFSGADLANLVNEAAIDATKNGKPAVDMASFEEANDKISLGVNQGNGSYSKEELKRTAYHEAGHALVGLLHPNQPRTLHKLTIGLRGNTLGVTHFKIESDEYSFTKNQLEAIIATSLGGYIAEELIYGKDNVSAGAASDLLNANKIAKDMVGSYGMADEQTLLVSEVFPGTEDIVISNAEVIIDRDYKQAKDILQNNMDKLNILVTALLENETLDYDQISELLKLKATPVASE